MTHRLDKGLVGMAGEKRFEVANINRGSDSEQIRMVSKASTLLNSDAGGAGSGSANSVQCTVLLLTAAAGSTQNAS